MSNVLIHYGSGSQACPRRLLKTVHILDVGVSTSELNKVCLIREMSKICTIDGPLGLRLGTTVLK